MSSFPEFAHLQISLADVKSACNNFADENFIRRGGFGPVYKGQLVHCGQLVNVAIKRLDPEYGQGEVQFWTEISMLSLLKHENLISIVGYCNEDNEKIIINKYEVNGSLDKYLSDSTLTWIQRLRICVGAARALSYIHNDTGDKFDVLHRNIKSSKILLDENWKPKVSGFNISTKNLASRRHRLVLEDPCGTVGYIDPIYLETGSVTHKSDVYSLGVVLFEVLCGRRAFKYSNNGRNQYLVPIAEQAYENGKLDEIIDPNQRKQMHPQTLAVFSETAYHCLKRKRPQRPDMKMVLKRLEKALDLQWKHENPEHSFNHLQDLDYFKIQLSDIMSATDNFAKRYRIGRGGYGEVYRAELSHFDSECSLVIEGKSKGELPRRHSSVAIKRIFSREDGLGDQGFLAEIDVLTKCKHPNVISLLGFCNEGQERILIYEDASNGSLEEYLGDTDNMTIFSWVQRLKICLDIAHGLNYLHDTMEEKQRIIHRDIKSANILLGKNWEAKIADFGLSRMHLKNHEVSTLHTYNIAGTPFYLDPEYEKTGNLKKESDIYSFGVVLFEILCGRLAYDEIYNVGNSRGLPYIAKHCFDNRTLLKELVDPKLKEDNGGDIFTLNGGPNKDSFDTFSKVAYQCLEETQAKRPTMKFIITELEKALYYQENCKDMLKIPFEDIQLATQNLSDKKCIGRGGFGKVYKGEISRPNGHKTIAAKRLDRKLGQGETEFLKELEILLDFKHENIVGLVGYCDDMDEKITVYEYASRGSLDKWLDNDGLTWMKRLRICIDIACGLEFLHGSNDVNQEAVIHRDIKSSNILLYDDWKAKITDFGLSLVTAIDKEMDYVIENAAGTIGYCDPLYIKRGFLTKESDIYSFGVVLFEILCGRHGFQNNDDDRFLDVLVRLHHEKGTLDKIVFKGIKRQIAPQSLTTFADIAYQCLQHERNELNDQQQVKC